MRFRILGPLQIMVGGRELDLGRSREQRVLAALLLGANRVVSLERLVDAVWDDRPPETAGKLVRNCVSTLRQRLAEPDRPDAIGTTPAGYVLRIAAGELDAEVFGQLVDQGRRSGAAGDLTAAVAALREALALWRGPALAGMSGRMVDAAAAALDEQRLTALEECLSYELSLGRDQELVAELSGLVAEHPLRERLRGQLMRALYRAGRRADALEVYRRGRQSLVDELGLEPGAELRELERAILADETDAEPAAPAAPPRVVPAQLPPDVVHFTGRAGYLTVLDALTSGTVTIVGAPGVGKTTLAVHWAHRVRSRYPDGQLYVNLRGYGGGDPLRAIDALAQFLAALGVPDTEVPVEVEAAAARYRSVLADRRVLVLLDNAASAEQVRPLLPGGSGCLVLITARDRLAGLVARDGARLLTLDVLSPAEAYDLLVEALGEKRATGDPAATAELTRLCARLPLALRIAAAHLTERRHRPLRAYVSGLAEGNRIAALAVEGDADTAVRSAFDLSYAALPDEARRTFRCLGLVPGPDVTAPAVAALTGAPSATAAGRVLDRLAAAHLVQEHADGRYTFHDLLRAYAADRAAEQDTPAQRDAATGRLLDWYRDSVDAAAGLLFPEILRLPCAERVGTGAPFTDSAGALAWLDAERANIVAAVTHGPARFGWTVSDLLRGYFHQRMCTVDWLTVATAGLTAAQRDGNVQAQAAAELSLGDLHWRLSRYPEAIVHYRQSAELAAKAGWVHGAGAVHGNLGNVYQQGGALDQAVEEYQKALANAERLNWGVGIGANLENLGAAYWEAGRLAESVEYASRAIAMCRKTGFRFAEGVALTGLAEVYHALGRYGEATGHLTRALALHREVGNRGGEAETFRVQALVARDGGDLAQARELVETALAMTRAAGDRRYEADALNTLGTIRYALGDRAGALADHRAALALSQEIGNRYPEVEAQLGIARTERDAGRLDTAREAMRDGLVMAGNVGYRRLEDAARELLADLDSAAPDHQHGRVDLRRRPERAARQG